MHVRLRGLVAALVLGPVGCRGLEEQPAYPVSLKSPHDGSPPYDASDYPSRRDIADERARREAAYLAEKK